MLVSVAVEGFSDEGVIEAVLSACDISIGGFYGRRGKSELLKRLPGYNMAAVHGPWVVLVDLDRESCVVDARRRWLPDPTELMCFRIAVTEAEAWLLADAEAISEFLGVSPTLIPNEPEKLDDPKSLLTALARKSRKRDIREGLAPRPGSGAGPLLIAVGGAAQALGGATPSLVRQAAFPGRAAWSGRAAGRRWRCRRLAQHRDQPGPGRLPVTQLAAVLAGGHGEHTVHQPAGQTVQGTGTDRFRQRG